MTRKIGLEKPSADDRRGFGSRRCMTGSVTCVALGSLAMFIIFWCTNVFRDSILSGLAIRNGTPMFDWWQRPPVRLVYRIRVFNYTNVKEFESGKAKKLRVEEAGPYVYRETLTRVNSVMNGDGTVSYQEKRSFQWEGGSPDDEIVTVPNVPLLAAVAFVRDMGFVPRVGLTAILGTIQAKPFVDIPAGGCLWGYENKVFELAKPIISFQENIPFDKFGILAVKNGLSEDRITMKTGEDDINELGLFEKLNGRRSRNVWGDERCDKIEGTDGSMFPPNLTQDLNSTLKIYSRDMCRSLSLKYHGHGTAHGIPTLTYKPPIDAMTATATKDNCYCPKTNPSSRYSKRTCPPAGIFNTSVCNFNMPIMTSFPHFYAADKKLLDAVDGLDPRVHLHESAVEIHPRLGVPVGGHSRIQMNIEVRTAVGVPFLGKLQDGTIIPLIWVEVAMDSVPQSVVDAFHHAFFTAGAVEAGMQWASVVGIVFCICSVVCMLKQKHLERHAGLRRNVSGQNPLIE